MKRLVSVGKAFADSNRVRVLSALRSGELCVCELAEALDLTQSTLSTHLQVLRESGLVQSRRQGKWMYYALDKSMGRLTRSVFKFFGPEVAVDSTLVKDRKSLEARLACREQGECCVGFKGKAQGKKQ